MPSYDAPQRIYFCTDYCSFRVVKFTERDPGSFLFRKPAMPNKGKGRADRPDQQIYAQPLPLVPIPSTTLFARSLSLIRLHVVSIENPHCVGIFDEPSRSVWIVNARDRDILWRRGFFGKGNLSRSEPSWLNRRLNQLGRTTTKGLCFFSRSFNFHRSRFFSFFFFHFLLNLISGGC